MFKALMKKRDEGFTLVELMIVVAIIGVLAALAIYGVSRYLRHSKTAEATRNLGAIETGSKQQYQLDSPGSDANTYVHRFCESSARVPTTVPKAQKVSSSTSWSTEGWKCLKFSINEPHFYAYSYSATGEGASATYSAAAEGDLDGNDTTSSFILLGEANPTTGDARRKSLTITNEDE